MMYTLNKGEWAECTKGVQIGVQRVCLGCAIGVQRVYSLNNSFNNGLNNSIYKTTILVSERLTIAVNIRTFTANHISLKKNQYLYCIKHKE